MRHAAGGLGHHRVPRAGRRRHEAVLVREGDPTAWARRSSPEADPPRRAAMGAAGLAKAETYAWPRIADAGDRGVPASDGVLIRRWPWAGAGAGLLAHGAVRAEQPALRAGRRPRPARAGALSHVRRRPQPAHHRGDRPAARARAGPRHFLHGRTARGPVSGPGARRGTGGLRDRKPYIQPHQAGALRTGAGRRTRSRARTAPS